MTPELFLALTPAYFAFAAVTTAAAYVLSVRWFRAHPLTPRKCRLLVIAFTVFLVAQIAWITNSVVRFVT